MYDLYKYDASCTKAAVLNPACLFPQTSQWDLLVVGLRSLVSTIVHKCPRVEEANVSSTTCTCIACVQVTVRLTWQCVYSYPCFAQLLTPVQGIGGVHASGYADIPVIYWSLQRIYLHHWHRLLLACFVMVTTVLVDSALWTVCSQLHANV